MMKTLKLPISTLPPSISAASSNYLLRWLSPSHLQRNTFSTSSSARLPSSSSSSVSKEEVSKFSSMAETWWDPNSNPLISMNPVRMSFILKNINSHNYYRSLNSSFGKDKPCSSYMPLKGLKALDVGCGGGLLSESLSRLGADVIGIDPSSQVAQAAKEHSKYDSQTRSIKYRGGVSVEDLATEYNHAFSSPQQRNHELFDIVCILEVIEHANDPKSLLRSASSLLKKPTKDHPGGMLFLSTVNRTAKSFGVAIVGAEYLLGKLPVGTHSWGKFKSPSEINKSLMECGLREVNVNGMVLKPPYVDMAWKLDEKDFDINWIGSYVHNTIT